MDSLKQKPAAAAVPAGVPKGFNLWTTFSKKVPGISSEAYAEMLEKYKEEQPSTAEYESATPAKKRIMVARHYWEKLNDAQKWARVAQCFSDELDTASLECVKELQKRATENDEDTSVMEKLKQTVYELVAPHLPPPKASKTSKRKREELEVAPCDTGGHGWAAFADVSFNEESAKMFEGITNITCKALDLVCVMYKEPCAAGESRPPLQQDRCVKAFETIVEVVNHGITAHHTAYRMSTDHIPTYK